MNKPDILNALRTSLADYDAGRCNLWPLVDSAEECTRPSVLSDHQAGRMRIILDKLTIQAALEDKGKPNEDTAAAVNELRAMVKELERA